MDKKLIQSLIEYGLSANEAKVYLILLQKLEASVFELAKATSIPRATVYLTLEKMKKEGLVSSLKKNKVLYFTAENPKRLSFSLEEKKKILNEILPELGALIGTDREKPDVKIYTGELGVKIVLEEILDVMSKEKNYSLYAASQSKIMDLFPRYFPDWIKRREDAHIRTQLLLPDNERSRHVFDANPLREVRYIPNEFSFSSTIEIFGKRMAVFNLKDDEVYSIIIESAPVVETFTQLFKFAWSNAK